MLATVRGKVPDERVDQLGHVGIVREVAVKSVGRIRFDTEWNGRRARARFPRARARRVGAVRCAAAAPVVNQLTYEREQDLGVDRLRAERVAAGGEAVVD